MMTSSLVVPGHVAEAELLEGKIRPLYIVAGEEGFWASRLCRLLEPGFPGGKESFYLEDVELADIFFMVSQPTFFGGKLFFLTGAEDVLVLEETGLGSVAEGNCLLLVAKIKPAAVSQSWLSRVSELGGMVVDASPPDSKTAAEWVETEVRRLGGRIRKDAAQYLVFLVGRKLLRLESEVQKGVLFAAGKEITRSMVDEFCSPDSEANAFALVDAVASGNVQRALAEIPDLMAQGFNVPRIFSILASQFALVWKVKERLMQGVPPQKIAAELGVHPFAAEKAMRQASAWSFSALRQAFKCLLEADENLKTGKVDAGLACEHAICYLAALCARRSRA
ncbi:MAG: DNA polymerase III subunit delta [Firmicutes bacterium]|nr:DNA polymerase III subunit delta [Candidatus Fermentithermobacillaceae bacterium]